MTRDRYHRLLLERGYHEKDFAAMDRSWVHHHGPFTPSVPPGGLADSPLGTMIQAGEFKVPAKLKAPIRSLLTDIIDTAGATLGATLLPGGEIGAIIGGALGGAATDLGITRNLPHAERNFEGNLVGGAALAGTGRFLKPVIGRLLPRSDYVPPEENLPTDRGNAPPSQTAARRRALRRAVVQRAQVKAENRSGQAAWDAAHPVTRSAEDRRVTAGESPTGGERRSAIRRTQPVRFRPRRVPAIQDITPQPHGVVPPTRMQRVVSVLNRPRDILHGNTANTERMDQALASRLRQFNASGTAVPEETNRILGPFWDKVPEDQRQDMVLYLYGKQAHATEAAMRQRGVSVLRELLPNSQDLDRLELSPSTHPADMTEEHAALRGVIDDIKNLPRDQQKIAVGAFKDLRARTFVPRLSLQKQEAMEQEPWFHDAMLEFQKAQKRLEGGRKAIGQKVFRQGPEIPGIPAARRSLTKAQKRSVDAGVRVQPNARLYSPFLPIREGGTAVKGLKYDPITGENIPVKATPPSAPGSPQSLALMFDKQTGPRSGLSEHGYETDPESVSQHWVGDVTRGLKRKALFDYAQHEGYIVPVPKSIKPRQDLELTPTPPARPRIPPGYVKQQLKMPRQLIMNKGGIPRTVLLRGDYAVHPTLARELEESRKFMGPAETSVRKNIGDLNQHLMNLRLRLSGAGLSHAGRIVSTAANGPVDRNITGKILSGLGHAGSEIATYGKLASLDFANPAVKDTMLNLARHDALNLRSYEGVDVERIASRFLKPFGLPGEFLFDDPRKVPDGIPEPFKSYWGLEARARIVRAQDYIQHVIEHYHRVPNWLDVANYVNKIGAYGPKSQHSYVRWLKNTIMPFLAFQSHQIPTEIQLAAGVHGLPTNGLSPAVKAGLASKTLWRGPISNVLARYAVQKLVNDQTPQTSAAGLTVKSPAGHTWNIGAGYSATSRGLRLLGANAVLAAMNQKGNAGKKVNAGLQSLGTGYKNELLSLLNPIGVKPLAHLALNLGEGKGIHSFDNSLSGDTLNMAPVIGPVLTNLMNPDPLTSVLVGEMSPAAGQPVYEMLDKKRKKKKLRL